MGTVPWITAAILCAALCAYGVTTAARRQETAVSRHPRTGATLGIASLGRSRRVPEVRRELAVPILLVSCRPDWDRYLVGAGQRGQPGLGGRGRGWGRWPRRPASDAPDATQTRRSRQR